MVSRVEMICSCILPYRTCTGVDLFILRWVPKSLGDTLLTCLYLDPRTLWNDWFYSSYVQVLAFKTLHIPSTNTLIWAIVIEFKPRNFLWFLNRISHSWSKQSAVEMRLHIHEQSLISMARCHVWWLFTCLLSGFNSRRTRGHRSNRVLPNPREITTKVTTTNVVLNYEGVSAHIMQWGQFIAHEFTQLSEVQGKLLNCIPFFLEIMAFKCQRVIANWAYQEIMEKWKVSITPLFIYLNLFIMVPLH